MARRNTRSNTKVRASVKKLEDEFRRLYDNIPIAMWRASITDGKLMKANMSCAKLLGFANVEQLEARSWWLPKSPGYENFVSHIKKDKCVYNFELPCRREDGGEIVLSLTAKLCESDGYIEGSMSDITTRYLELHREEQQQREIESLQNITSQIKNRLASGM